MATATKKYVKSLQQIGGVPYGNMTVHRFTFETNSSGVWVDSDQATAVNIADITRIGILPAGMRLDDALAIISDAFASSVTAKVGFAYVDGVDSTSVPQDDDYFIVAGTSLASAARTRANNTAVRPVILPKDAYVIITHAGANHSAVGQLDFLVMGVDTGRP